MNSTGSRRAPAVAADGTGELLFVYTADVAGRREVRARRFSATGVAREDEDAFILLASDVGIGWDAQPNVAGLAGGGWVVVWTDPAIDGDGAGIAMRRVFADGSLGSVQFANETVRGSQREGRVASTGSGWAVVWTDESGFDGPLGQSIVRMRTFNALGTAVGGEIAVSDTSGSASEPAIGSLESGTVLVVWTQAATDETALSTIMARRVTGDPTAPFVVSDPGGAQPAVTAVNGSFVTAWVRRDPAYDFLGDIQVRAISGTGDPLPPENVIATLTERGPGDPPHAELAPSIAPFGEGILVAYEDGGTRRGIAYVSLDADVMAPESTELQSYLSDGLQGDVTLLATPRGVWFAWSDASDSSGAGDPRAYRSFLAFLLPHD